MLKSKNKATIVPPEWLEPAALEEVLRQERESSSFQVRLTVVMLRHRTGPVWLRNVPAARKLMLSLQALPFHYIEIATVLFKHAGEAFGDRRQRVQDLFENIRRRAPSRLLCASW